MAVKNGMKSKGFREFRLLCILQLRYTLPGRMQPLSASMEDGRTGFMKQNIMQKTFLLLGGRKENLKEKLLYYGLEDLTVHIGKKFFLSARADFFKNGKRTDGGGCRGALHCLSGKSTSITEGVPAFEG